MKRVFDSVNWILVLGLVGFAIWVWPSSSWEESGGSGG
jgi:hypothetical protein